jgi:formylglycine-generating enzyme required for sulfatase activity
MRVFISYASEDRQSADEIHLALRGAGYASFFDRDELEAGADFHSRIASAVRRADVLVFLISPHSLAQESYAQTELNVARKTWPHPKGRLIPVRLRNTSLDSISPYLRSVALLEPAGNIAAEVVRAVDDLRQRRVRARVKRALYGTLVLVVALGVAIAVRLSGNPSQNEPDRVTSVPDSRATEEASPPSSSALPTVAAPVTDCFYCPALVELPMGQFLMGSVDSERDRDADEGPVHEVRFRYRLAVGKFEVTLGEFKHFIADTKYKTDAERRKGCQGWNGLNWAASADRTWRTPGFTQTDSHPAVCVSWNDAQAYLRWLNTKQPDKRYRLLTEAEWEYAARAGRGAIRFPWGNDSHYREMCTWANVMDATGRSQISGVTWVAADCTDGHAYTAPADALKPNPFGLYNMHGNAAEWVEDVMHGDYVGATTDGSVWIKGSGRSTRGYRGGSWAGMPSFSRSANRGWEPVDASYNYLGFRIGRTL